MQLISPTTGMAGARQDACLHRVTATANSDQRDIRQQIHGESKYGVEYRDTEN
jgi:hypothetical protein